MFKTQGEETGVPKTAKRHRFQPSFQPSLSQSRGSSAPLPPLTAKSCLPSRGQTRRRPTHSPSRLFCPGSLTLFGSRQWVLRVCNRLPETHQGRLHDPGEMEEGGLLGAPGKPSFSDKKRAKQWGRGRPSAVMHRAAAALVEPWGRKRPSGASPRPTHFRPGRARSQSGCPAAVCAGCLSGRLPPWPSLAHSMTTGNFLWVSTDRGWEAFCLFHQAVPQLVPKAFKRTCSASSPRPARPASGLLRLRAVAPALPCFLLQPEWAPLARPRRCSLGAALGGRADAAAPEGRPTRALALAACRARGTSPPGLPLAPPGACTPTPTPAKHPCLALSHLRTDRLRLRTFLQGRP